MTSVLKLGGSVITRKTGRREVDRESLDAALDAVSAADDVALVHGAGSYGHPQAAAVGVTESEGVEDARSATEVQRAVRELNDVVVDGLHGRGVDAVALHPSSYAYRDGCLEHSVEVYEAALSRGFLPVAHGDVVVDGERGFSVVSGDDVAVELARALDVRLGMCTSAGGVLDGDGEPLSRVSDVDDVEVFDVEGDDVTGGVEAKVEKLLGLERGGQVFGVEDVGDYLEGDEPGTTVRRK
ncbi:MAG: isopentenyl phosphate kinase [Halobacteriota archaeon]